MALTLRLVFFQKVRMQSPLRNTVVSRGGSIDILKASTPYFAPLITFNNNLKCQY